MLLAGWLAMALGAEPATLTLHIGGVASAEGHLLVVLFNSEDGWPSDPKKAVRSTMVAAKPGVVTVTFDDLPPGVYAGSVVHDLDDDRVCDVKWPIPIPKEPVGMTRDAKGHFGPPKFADAALQVSGKVEHRLTLVQL